jgi:hypothetical protein
LEDVERAGRAEYCHENAVALVRAIAIPLRQTAPRAGAENLDLHGGAPGDAHR